MYTISTNIKQKRGAKYFYMLTQQKPRPKKQKPEDPKDKQNISFQPSITQQPKIAEEKKPAEKTKNPVQPTLAAKVETNEPNDKQAEKEELDKLLTKRTT